MQIILASGSPRRKQLLEWAEIEFSIVIPDTDETFPEGLGYEEIAMHIAHTKAEAIAKDSGRDEIIIAADTIVVCNDQILGKPVDSEDAQRMLLLLSGNKHRVITGVSIISSDKQISFADITEVEFYPLTADQISYYINKYRPFDKAGAYAIQEWIGVTGIKSIKGDFYNVMGLPVSRVVASLKEIST